MLKLKKLVPWLIPAVVIIIILITPVVISLTSKNRIVVKHDDNYYIAKSPVIFCDIVILFKDHRLFASSQKARSASNPGDWGRIHSPGP